MPTKKSSNQSLKKNSENTQKTASNSKDKSLEKTSQKNDKQTESKNTSSKSPDSKTNSNTNSKKTSLKNKVKNTSLEKDDKKIFSKKDWKKYFEDKNNFLEKTKDSLKHDFIGNHEIIDQFFELLKIWYLTPDVLTRPIIINLWGMTGCGKTDFVRKLCKYLDFQEKLVEVDLSQSSRTWGGIDRRVKDMSIDHNQPFVLLFDEIQNYRTVNEDGKTESKMDRFDDLWQILSDGKISKDSDDIDSIFETLWDIESNVEKRDEGGKSKFKSIAGFDWSNRRFRRMAPYLKNAFGQARIEDITMEDLTNFDSKSFQKQLFDPIDYSKALIIISGNLDEAFFDSGLVDEVEVDPDIFHSRSKNINLLDVKKALSKRFRPEQISRFGNNHLIYPALSSDSFTKIIQKELSQKRQQYAQRYNIELEFSSGFVDLIFKNGVFPTQGVRPLFSTISQITDVTIAKFLPEMLEEGYKKAFLDYVENYHKNSETVVKATTKEGDGAITQTKTPIKTHSSKIQTSKTQDSSFLNNQAISENKASENKYNPGLEVGSEIVVSITKSNYLEDIKFEDTNSKSHKYQNSDIFTDQNLNQSLTIQNQDQNQDQKKIIRIPFVGQIDKLRKKNDQDTLALVSVHEAAHSIVYSHLLSLAPIQIKASLANSGGFIFPHKIHTSKQMLKCRIQILLAGFLGEKMIFGSEKISAGAANDIDQATSLASEYVRRYGFGDSLIKAVGNYNTQADYYISENGYGNTQIQNLVDDSSNSANLILEKHRTLLLEVATKLAKEGQMEIDEYIQICQKHGLKIQKQDEDYQVIENYWQTLMSLEQSD
jgi:hypothetical protein